MERYYLNDDIFFLLEKNDTEEDDILLWNYRTNEQYLISNEYFQRIRSISKTHQSEQDEICQNLLETQIISTTPPKASNWEWDILSKIFHIGTSDLGSEAGEEDPRTFARNYLSDCAEIAKKELHLFQEKPGPNIALPEADLSLLDRVSILDAIKKRKTCRDFFGKPIDLVQLSTILFASFGLIHGDWEELKRHQLKEVGLRKASPSGGGIHPEEAYVVVYRVEGLSPGLYYYRPQDHQLTLIKEGDFEKEVIQLNLQQFFSEGLAFGVYVTGKFDKTWWKYKHSRAYRVVLFDIAHASQTFQLCATALGLQTWITGAFHDAGIRDFLHIAESFEYPLLFLGAGIGSGSAIPPMMLEELQD